MTIKHNAQKIKFLLLITAVLVFPALALMPPEVYIKRIEDSKIKALAKVNKVEVIETTEHRRTLLVTFELVKSYAEAKPGKVFTGKCYAPGEKPLLGGDIYFHPAKGDSVFVTINSTEKGMITSYTIASDKIIKALQEHGLSGLRYSIGKVMAK